MRRRELRFGRLGWGVIGIVVIVAITWAVFTKLNVFSSSFTIKGIFTTAASQIQSGSPVRIAGVNVGKVTAVGRGPGDTAQVTMNIQSNGLPIHSDATMKIRPRLFLEGNFFVDLSPGTSSAPDVSAGHTFGLSQTSTPVQVDQVLNIFTIDPRTGMQQIIKGFGTALQDGGAQALSNVYQRLSPASIPLAESTEAAQGEQPNDLRDFIVKAAEIAGTLSNRSGQIGTLLSTFNQTMGAFAAQQNNLKATFVQLNGTLSSAGPTLSELDRVIPPLTQFAVAIRPALDKAPSVLTDATPLLDAAQRLLAPSVAPVLLRELSPALSSLDQLERQLPTLLNLVTPVGRCVANKVVPVVDQPVNDGKLSTGQPVWQELARYPVGLTSSAQNYSGNGYGVRYSFGLSEHLIGTNLGSLDNLLELSSTPLSGARPQYTPGSQPPLEPNADCQTQPLTSLAATNVPAPKPAFDITLKKTKPWTPSQLAAQLKTSLGRLEGHK
ncbi:MAG TPA: MlaD family protein [Solirubrobacteraceae bacterium]|nr:MlaD family protein [Solirubrobacteraceae bacterium]